MILEDLVAQMKKLGVLHLKTAEYEVLLGPGHLPPPTHAHSGESKMRGRHITDEDMLFSATEGLPGDP